jgi:hypothetical protein
VDTPILRIAARSSGASSGQRSITVLNSGSISRLQNKPETSSWLSGTESVRFDSVSGVFSEGSELRLRGLEPLTFGSVDRRSVQLSYRRFIAPILLHLTGSVNSCKVRFSEKWLPDKALCRSLGLPRHHTRARPRPAKLPDAQRADTHRAESTAPNKR